MEKYHWVGIFGISMLSRIYNLGQESWRLFFAEDHQNDTKTRGRRTKIKRSLSMDNDHPEYLPNDELFRLFLKNTPGALAMFDTKMNYVLVSDQWFAAYGLEGQDIIGKNHYEVFPEIIENKEWLQIHQRCINGETMRRERDAFERADGTIDWIRWEIKPWYKADRTIGGIIMFTEVITERVKLENQLKESEKKFSAIFNNTFNFIGLLDVKGTMLEANQTALDFGGVSREQAVGLKFWEAPWWSLAESSRQQLKEAIQRASTGEFVRYEVDVKGKDRILTIDFSLTPIRDEFGDISYIIPEGRDISPRKAVEMKLQQANTLMTEIQETAKIGTWWVDVERSEAHWSDEVYRIHEVPIGTAISVNDGIKFYRSDYQTLIQQSIKNAIDNHSHWDVEAILVTAKGKEVWVRAIGQPIFSEGKITQLRGIFMDINERKSAEQRTEEGRRQLEEVFQTVQDFICLHDTDGNYVKVSPSFARSTGYSEAELIGRSPYEFFHPDDMRRIREDSHQRMLDKETEHTRIEYRFRHRDGHYMWFHTTTSSIMNANGAVHQLVTSTVDITERKAQEDVNRSLNENLEEKVRDRTQQLERISLELRQQIETLNTCALVSITDRDGNITYVNELFCLISGYDREELLGENHRILKSEKHSSTFFHSLWNSISNGEIWQGEICNHHRDGSKYWVYTTIAPFLDTEGRIEKYVSIRFDITALKEMEGALKTKAMELLKTNRHLDHANKELETFSYSVSHDLKAPLRALQGFSKNLMNKYSGQLDAKGDRWLNFIHDNAIKMDELIHDILMFSRVSRSELEKTSLDMREIVQGTLKLQRSGVNNKLEVSIGNLPPAYADLRLMKLVWQNLIDNALKYSKHRDVIHIEVSSRSDEQFDYYSVKDNGVGFDMKYADKLFKIFQRLHHESEFEGTGVGLANVQRILLKHGGDITAVSEVGKGSTFEFKLPRSEQIR